MNISLVLLIAISLLSTAYQSCSGEDKRLEILENETRKLERNTNPENRTESLIKIADIRLTFVNDAARNGELPEMHSQLEQYQETIVEARTTMMESGLDPYRRSRGYRLVEMSLRQHLRFLGDISRDLTLEQREPVEAIIRLVSEIRDEFIQALFG